MVTAAAASSASPTGWSGRPSRQRSASTIRRQELDGFSAGLFNGRAESDLPAKAYAAVTIFGDIRVTVAGVHDLMRDGKDAASGAEIEGLISQLRELTLILEKEIHAVLLDCTRARRHILQTAAAAKPKLHWPTRDWSGCAP